VRPLGVVPTVKRAFARKHLFGTLIGYVLGGFVPIAIYVIAHQESGSVVQGWHISTGNGLVLGGLVYSAQTVYQWAKAAFTQALKSVGFCVLLEGVMVTAHTHWLTLTALALLVVINGTATGCTLSVGQAR
jgi:hypothetical protein